MKCRIFDTPTGPMQIRVANEQVVRVTWLVANTPRLPENDEDPLLDETQNQLCEYFQGTRTDFTLPLAPTGTMFQHTVWAAMMRIPYGGTQTYGELAKSVGTAARAVGGACGANPIPVIIPCHRVTAANGKLGGFSGGVGDATKIELLELETKQPRLNLGSGV